MPVWVLLSVGESKRYWKSAKLVFCFLFFCLNITVIKVILCVQDSKSVGWSLSKSKSRCRPARAAENSFLALALSIMIIFIVIIILPCQSSFTNVKICSDCLLLTYTGRGLASSCDPDSIDGSIDINVSVGFVQIGGEMVGVVLQQATGQEEWTEKLRSPGTLSASCPTIMHPYIVYEYEYIPCTGCFFNCSQPKISKCQIK